MQRVLSLLLVLAVYGCGEDVAGPSTPSTVSESRPAPPPPPADPAIAYGSRTGKGFNVTYSLAVMNADGSNQTTLTSAAGSPQPSWSPDGHSIIYHPTTYEISRVDVSVVNGVPQASAPVALPITHQSFNMAWSPDPSNSQIAYSEDQANIGAPAGLYLAPAAPVTPYNETLLYLGAPGNRMIWISWNPQATRIAFIQRSINQPVDSLFVVDVATSSATFVRSFIRGVFGLSWSRTAPDRLALDVPLPNGAGSQPSFLDLTTNTLSNAPTGFGAKWSPDDSRLVYYTNGNAGTNPIYAVTLSTGAQVQLAANGVNPEWRRNP